MTATRAEIAEADPVPADAVRRAGAVGSRTLDAESVSTGG